MEVAKKNKRSVKVNLKRRRLLQSFSILGAASATGCVAIPNPVSDSPSKDTPLEFDLSRADDHFYAKLEAWNFELVHSKGKYYLQPICECSDAYLVFIFPPQNYAETTIQIEDEVSSQLDSVQDAALDLIDLHPSKKSKLVFKVPSNLKELELSLESLLDWSKFEYIAPDLDTLSSKLQANPYKRHALGLEWFEKELHKFSSVELPWGIYLQPLGKYKEDYEWRHMLLPREINGRTELWFSQLENKYGRHLPLEFEALDVRGLNHLGHDPLSRTSYFKDSTEYYRGREVTECSPVTNFDRLEIMGSLSRRFKYSGVPASNSNESINTDALKYLVSDDLAVPTNACYVDGRSVEVQTFGISAFGGWLELEAEWDPKPGCALRSWSHSSTFGRDNSVQFKRLGFLYPFGIPAELVILSEREFVKDLEGHYVAPLLKRALIQIPQPNVLEIEHGESPFITLSIITDKTPPLDLPKSGNFIEYAMCDYFLPIVDGQPFSFEHLGVDHEGQEITSSMPMYFVSNKTTDANGLIKEPNYVNNPRTDKKQKQFLQDNIKPRFQGALQSCPPSGGSLDCEIDEQHPEYPKKKVCKTKPNSGTNCSLFGSDGLWELDRVWINEPFRFSSYQNKKIALADSTRPGNTSQEVEWIEWVRAEVPKLDAVDHIAKNPFIPRARVMKVSLQGMNQFSGQKSYMLATYRDVRFKDSQVLDPKPTIGDTYDINVFTQDSDCNVVGAYAHILPLDGQEVTQELINSLPNTNESDKKIRTGLSKKIGTVVPFRAAEKTNDKIRLSFIRSIYFELSTGATRVPLSLFENLENEVSFGRDSTTDAQGGIATPDSPIGILTREQGPLGDNIFDPKIWKESYYEDDNHPEPEALKYREFYLNHKTTSPTDPYDQDNLIPYVLCPSEEKRTRLASMGVALPTVSPNDMAGFGNIASMFGLDAEILPGVRLTSILAGAGIDLGGGDQAGISRALAANTTSRAPKWDYKINGLDEILTLFGDGPGQISFADAATLFSQAPAIDEPGDEITFGFEASLEWTTNSISSVDLGAIDFKPNNSIFSVLASAKLDLLGGKPIVEARAELTDFNIIVFKSLDIQFLYVSFELDSDGNKDFDPKIGIITFTGALSFINNIQSILSGLEEYLGVSIDLTPQAVTVSQTIALPPPENPTDKGGVLRLGAVEISNLYLWWSIQIPLIGRDVTTVALGCATKEDPMAVYIVPFFGGKSHALLEVTTNGIRLFEVSIEIGGMIKATYSIAKGEASIMAGTYFMIAKSTSGEKTFMLSAYVKAMAQLIVAGFIDFTGIIMLSLTYVKTSGGEACNEGEVIAGEASITVSVKIGFVRYSYSFTAREEQRMSGGSQGDCESKLLAFADGANTSSSDTNSDSEQQYIFQSEQFVDCWDEFVSGYAN